MDEFLKQIGPYRPFVAVAIVALLAYEWRAQLVWLLEAARGGVSSLSGRFTATGTGATNTLKRDMAEFQALSMLKERADRRGCPECQAAVQQFLAHWYDGEE